MNYTTREAAEVVGLSEAVVRSCARAGFLSPRPQGGVALRFSFRDLLVLRVVKALDSAGIPHQRIRRQLKALRARLPEGVCLSSVSIESEGGHIVVRSDSRAWRPDTGQIVFDFSLGDSSADARPPAEIRPLELKPRAEPPEPVRSMTSDEWFERAVELEEKDPYEAIESYKRALQLRPDCTETLINMGRLRAESGDTAGAAECFREALAIDPCDATALYNLGVVAQDEERDPEAIELYRRALELDPGLAEAHYNLATLFDRCGEGRQAIRHINEYRKLMKQS